jgi:hypothetical protein
VSHAPSGFAILGAGWGCNVAGLYSAAGIYATSVATSAIASETITPVATTNYCLECHSDKETLIRTAKPEEKALSESEGVG